MSDATITQTNRNHAPLAFGAAALLGGFYLYEKSTKKKGDPSSKDVLNVCLLTSAGLAAYALYSTWASKKTPIGTISGLPPYQGPGTPQPSRSFG